MMIFPKEVLLVDFFSGVKANLLAGDEDEKEEERERGCILVGNSGNMIGSSLGERIEEFGYVVRMNGAPGGGIYRGDVGGGTDIRVCAHNAIGRIPLQCFNNLKHLIIWTPRTSYNRIVPIVRKIQNKYPRLHIYRLTDRALQLNDNEYLRRTGHNRYLSGAWLSTGWFSIFILLNLFPKVTVCGFGCLKGSNIQTPYHYWDALNGGEQRYIMKQQESTKGHRFCTEMRIFGIWQREMKLHFIT